MRLEYDLEVLAAPRSFDLTDASFPVLIHAYPVAGPRGPQGFAAELSAGVLEVPTGAYNGINATFQLSEPCFAPSLRVFRNGLLEMPTIGYSLVGTTLTLTTPPLTTDLITVTYYIQP